MNELELAAPALRWPEEITVEPSRLHTGLWGYSRGDIADAYCADIFPRLRAFIHEGHAFANLGGSEDSIKAYPLIPAVEYRGPAPRQYCYEGRAARWKGQQFTLGPKVVFACRERSLAEWADLLRRMYAYGGLFASGKTYAELLAEFLAGTRSEYKAAAIHAELARPSLPVTQDEMRLRLEQPETAQPAASQLGFGF